MQELYKELNRQITFVSWYLLCSQAADHGFSNIYFQPSSLESLAMLARRYFTAKKPKELSSPQKQKLKRFFSSTKVHNLKKIYRKRLKPKQYKQAGLKPNGLFGYLKKEGIMKPDVRVRKDNLFPRMTKKGPEKEADTSMKKIQNSERKNEKKEIMGWKRLRKILVFAI